MPIPFGIISSDKLQDKMDIDLFTFIAQICNFFILVIALYFFLYKKIIGAIDFREKKITDEFQEAEEKNKEAEALLEEYKEKNRLFHEQKEKMVKEAKEETVKTKEKWLDEMREEIKRKKEKWIEKIEEEKTIFLEEIEEKLKDHFVDTTKKIVRDLAEEKMQVQLIHKFFSLLEELDEEKKKKILEKWKERKEEKIFLSSSHSITKEEVEKIKERLEAFFGEELDLEYREDTHLLIGITIKFDGYKMEWSAREYLEQIRKEMEEIASVE